ncbi:MAG: hypothetical protein JSU73_06945 [candidate division WOR-3 bacterium]|nr:MAG: hypothetical protein JSU73_06945 [candidate division WOR-3 bacterium]
MKSVSILVVLVLATSFAQTGEQVRRELEKTDRLIDEAEPVVKASGSERAEYHLGNAKSLQQNAWSSYQDRKLVAALTYTRNARRQIEVALGFAEFDPSQLERELHKTDDAIERARPIIERSGNRRALELLSDATARQGKARNAFRAERYKEAFTDTRAARLMVEAALRLAQELNAAEIRRQLERTEELVRRYGPGVARSGNRRALELWDLALDEQRKARRHFQAAEYLMALRMTRAARGHCKKALDLIRPQTNQDKVRVALERTAKLLERARDFLQGNERAMELLARAEAWQDEAIAALREGRLLHAWRMTTSARDLILRAIELAGGDVRQELVEQALAETDNLLEQWTAVITQSENQEAEKLLDQAVASQQKSREHFDQKRFRISWQETTLARRLLDRAIELTQMQDEKQPAGLLPGPEEAVEN